MHRDTSIQFTLEHVAINTNDFAGSLAFYRDLLGFSVIEEVYVRSIGVRRAYLTAGPAKLELLAFDEPRAPGQDRQSQVGLRHLGVVVADVRAAHEQLCAAGLTFTLGPTPGAGSVRWKAILLGPDGVEIELIEH